MHINHSFFLNENNKKNVERITFEHWLGNENGFIIVVLNFSKKRIEITIRYRMGIHRKLQLFFMSFFNCFIHCFGVSRKICVNVDSFGTLWKILKTENCEKKRIYFKLFKSDCK